MTTKREQAFEAAERLLGSAEQMISDAHNMLDNAGLMLNQNGQWIKRERDIIRDALNKERAAKNPPPAEPVKKEPVSPPEQPKPVDQSSQMLEVNIQGTQHFGKLLGAAFKLLLFGETKLKFKKQDRRSRHG